MERQLGAEDDEPGNENRPLDTAVGEQRSARRSQKHDANAESHKGTGAPHFPSPRVGFASGPRARSAGSATTLI